MENEAELVLTARAVCDSLTAAGVEQIALELETLALHYPVMGKTDAENRVVKRNWIEDFEGWPADLISEACRMWRNSSERFFPTAGQLKALAQPMLDHREALGRRSREFLGLIAERDDV